MNNSTTTDTKFLPIRHAAARLGVHPETLRRWDNQGLITAHRTPSGYRRFKLSDLDALLQAGGTAAAS